MTSSGRSREGCVRHERPCCSLCHQGSLCGAAYQARRGDFRLVLCPVILKEFQRVLNRKLSASPEEVRETLGPSKKQVSW